MASFAPAQIENTMKQYFPFLCVMRTIRTKETSTLHEIGREKIAKVVVSCTSFGLRSGFIKRFFEMPYQSSLAFMQRHSTTESEACSPVSANTRATVPSVN